MLKLKTSPADMYCFLCFLDSLVKFQYSGALHCAVPICDTVLLLIVDMLFSCTIPKSINLGSHKWSSMIFALLISLWAIPCKCRYSNPNAIPSVIPCSLLFN
eukprot:NODE_457_length_8231_cov_0.314068.p6 type:complete len:102 gc:universal NODE_457_length_8231_cov_0.314068:5303-5608(+)